MSEYKNHVEITGMVGQEPTITNVEGGNKVSRFSLSTPSVLTNISGNEVETVNWNTIVAYKAVAQFVEHNVLKGSKIKVIGSLRTWPYTENGNTRYITEVLANYISLIK
tara:strand:- start:185 stop:511 length:327 start_codon:yes stop_codon:yes gene_type:complete